MWSSWEHSLVCGGQGGVARACRRPLSPGGRARCGCQRVAWLLWLWLVLRQAERGLLLWLWRVVGEVVVGVGVARVRWQRSRSVVAWVGGHGSPLLSGLRVGRHASLAWEPGSCWPLAWVATMANVPGGSSSSTAARRSRRLVGLEGPHQKLATAFVGLAICQLETNAVLKTTQFSASTTLTTKPLPAVEPGPCWQPRVV